MSINIINICDATWEVDWIKNVLFKYVDYKWHEDPLRLNVMDRAVIITNETDAAVMQEYVDEYKQAGCKFGIIHLSDEAYRHPVQYYKDAEFVYRNYYSKAYSMQENVKFFPLGYKSGTKSANVFLNPAKRKYIWNFIGQIAHKPTREAMANALAEIDGGFLYATMQWDDPNGLTTEKYQEILKDSIYTACPMGWINPDSFRLCEALESGSIPIVERRSYFEALFGGEVPFLSVRRWEDVEDLLESIEDVDALQKECIEWWADYKNSLGKAIKSAVSAL